MDLMETKAAITEILRIYDETRDTTPKNTVEKIVASMGTVKAGEAMAAMIKDCSWDGRISRENREYWQKVKSWNKESDDLGVAGINRLHRAHLDQIAEELRKIHRLSQNCEDEILPSDEEKQTPTVKQTM